MANKIYYDADNLPPSDSISVGTGFEPVYRLDPIADVVIRDGERDLQSMIQAAENSCRVDKLLERYEMTGDETIFQQRATLVADISAAPGSMAEAYMLLKQANDAFNGLPAADRQQYANFADFILSFQSKKEGVSA